jgi:hypothetical protein
MVEEGWDYMSARHVVEAVATNAGLGRARSTSAGGWRTLAQRTGLPPWQIRRLTVLLCGAPGWRGLIQIMLKTGHNTLRLPAVRNAIRATTDRRAPVPQRNTLEGHPFEPRREAFLKASKIRKRMPCLPNRAERCCRYRGGSAPLLVMVCSCLGRGCVPVFRRARRCVVAAGPPDPV